jgi:poly(hydroxyalkanoate) depolymerase family esterase
MSLNQKMSALMHQLTRLVGVGRPTADAPPAVAEAPARAPASATDSAVEAKADIPAAPVSEAPVAEPHPAETNTADTQYNPLELFPQLLAGWRLPSLFDQIELPLPVPEARPEPVADLPGAEHGEFASASFTNEAGTRTYKLYVPRGYRDGKAMPLVVMLHGCSQNPDDFAAGTKMNALADERQFLVAYPAQAPSANGSRCWNWFQSDDQKRDQGEPSIIAGITREIMQNYSVDPRQVYVAGLSAGGAMAVILGSAYPDLYAAVGVHSGLPYAAAKDLSTAMAAMHGRAGAEQPRRRRSPKSPKPVPVIVFHGDRDTTVHPHNGDMIVTQSVQAPPKPRVPASIEQGQVPNGHAYTRTSHRNADGQPIAEQWLVHGAGHAWSGGSRDGSFTDSKGPDASEEMLRFFSTHQQPRQDARN